MQITAPTPTTTINGAVVPYRFKLTQVDCLCEEATSYHAPSLDGEQGSDRLRIQAQLLGIQEHLEEVFETCEPDTLGFLRFSTTDADIIKRVCETFPGNSLTYVSGQRFEGGMLDISLDHQLECLAAEMSDEEADAINWEAANDTTYILNRDGTLSVWF